MGIVFWVAVSIMVYAYIGYPLALAILSGLLRKKEVKKKPITPSVSLIIAAHNEEAVIGEKLENALSLDYPKDKKEIIVASDCSTDRTNEIVSQYSDKGVKLFLAPARDGKTAAQRLAVAESKGEILLFSDANAMWEPDAIRKLVRNFNDESVGCVAGHVSHVEASGQSSAPEENLFRRYENQIRKLESDLTSVVGAYGSIYAVRREAYVPLKDYLIDDFVEPLEIIKRGYRCVCEPEAMSVEHLSVSVSELYKAKVRTSIGGFRGLFSQLSLFNARKFGFFSVQLLSHKLLRWLGGVLLPLIFISNVFLLTSSPVYAAFFVAQAFLYLSAVAAFFLEKKHIKVRGLHAPLYFVMLNLATLVAIYRCLRGEKAQVWTPAR